MSASLALSLKCLRDKQHDRHGLLMYPGPSSLPCFSDRSLPVPAAQLQMTSAHCPSSQVWPDDQELLANDM